MKVTLDIQQTLLIEELERVLERFHVPYQTDVLEKQTVTEEKRQARKATLQKFKGGLAKYGTHYNPTKGEWYEQ